MGRARAGLVAELGHVRTELRRLHERDDHPRVPWPLVGLATILLVLWGNVVVLGGRQLDSPDAVTLIAHPVLALVLAVLLLARGWRRGTLGFTRPVPCPASSRLRSLLGLLAVTAALTSALLLALEPAKRLDVIRLLLGTASGEEVLHRSVLLAIWSSSSVPPIVTTVVSAAAFGAWHFAGAFHEGAFHPLEVAVPTVGTLVFLWARLRYRSVVAPIVLHIATNLPGMVLLP